MKNKSEIFGRNINDWLLLTLGVLNIMVGIQQLSYLSYFNFFVAGLCFSAWLYVGIINSNFKLIDRSFELSKSLLHDLKNLNLNKRRVKNDTK